MTIKNSVTWSASKSGRELVSLVIPDNGDTAGVQIKVWPFTLKPEEAAEMALALSAAYDRFKQLTPDTAPVPQPV